MREILIVDDERAIRTGLKSLLEGEGYSVRVARDGDEAIREVSERRPDLVLLDAMMPRKNGFRTCEEIRSHDGDLPVVFLTAVDSEADEIRALGLGADDYLRKTDSSSLQLARIRRALSRAQKRSADTLRMGVVSVDLTNGRVSWNGGREKLTESELLLLKTLVANQPEFVSKEEIIRALRGSEFCCVDGMIYVHVHNLRRKLGPAADCIATDRSFGYRLRI